MTLTTQKRANSFSSKYPLLSHRDHSAAVASSFCPLSHSYSGQRQTRKKNQLASSPQLLKSFQNPVHSINSHYSSPLTVAPAVSSFSFPFPLRSTNLGNSKRSHSFEQTCCDFHTSIFTLRMGRLSNQRSRSKSARGVTNLSSNLAAKRTKRCPWKAPMKEAFYSALPTSEGRGKTKEVCLPAT